ncbi:MAG: fatty acyl-AMP ligase, partial [Desulfobacterales bacterium]
MTPTPTHNALPLCGAEFTTLTEALDYAALGNTGFNFYDGSGKLATVLSYAQLQQDAWSLAQRLWGLAS